MLYPILLTTHGPTPGPLHILLLPTLWCALHVSDVCFFVYLTVSPMGLEGLPEQEEIWFVLFMGILVLTQCLARISCSVNAYWLEAMPHCRSQPVRRSRLVALSTLRQPKQKGLGVRKGRGGRTW